MATLVVDLRDKRPIWAFPEWAKKAIREVLPASWSVQFLKTAADGSGDGLLRATPELMEAVRDARAYMGFGIPDELFAAAPKLEWVHSGAAGVGSSLGPGMLASDVIFTNSAGVHGPPIADTVLAGILHFGRGLDVAVRAQAQGLWGANEFWADETPVTELSGATVGIIGFGGIGRLVAARVSGLVDRVLALRRSALAEGDDQSVQVLVGEEGLRRIVAESDYLVLSAPETPETVGLMNRERLLAMKPGAVLLNFARGALVDESALLEALDEVPLRGAVLDVFSEEPLPSGHPFYRHPQLLITPHVSATTPRFWEREVELITDNLARFLSGEPLRNVVDKSAGY